VSETKHTHTSGPWFAEDWSRDDGPDKFTIAAHEPEKLSPGQSSIWPDGIRKLRIASTEEGDGDRLANARLISAAPDMLEALKAVRDWDDNANPAGYGGLRQDVRDVVHAAIRKAEGSLT